MVQELVSSGAYCNIDQLDKFIKSNMDEPETHEMILSSVSANDNLIAAMKALDWEEAESLLEKSACVHTKELLTQRTPLHFACMQEEECPWGLMSLMISKKADLLGRDFQGWT